MTGVFQGRPIVVGVTGGIAAYKAAELVSQLSKAGARVHVVMTESALQFVAPLTFQTLSGRPVLTSLFAEESHGKVTHVNLAEEAELFILAPATANLIGKAANGLADDLLSTMLLVNRAPVVLAPAMNCHMWANPILQKNLEKLSHAGWHLVEPEEGVLACGDVGVGRLAGVDKIMAKATEVLILSDKRDYAGRTVLVTAGGTREAIDPVRYLSNHSSGKMGYAIAEAAAKRGAKTILISGPTALKAPAGVEMVPVTTASEMEEGVLSRFSEVDVVIKAAAVADYRPVKPAEQKIKKTGDRLVIELEKNPDILGRLGQLKGPNQVLVGFAAETENLEAHALDKLNRKNLDCIVANDVTQPGAGFGSDTNIVTLYKRDGSKLYLEKQAKEAVAHRLLDEISRLPQLAKG